MSRREEVEYLFERSRRFYESSSILAEKGFYDLAVFCLEQSLQLYLKAALLELGIDYPRSHSIRKLLEIIYKITLKEEVKEILSRFAVELGALEDAYITLRYVPREYTREEFEKLRRTVDEVLKIVGGAASRRS